MYGDCIESSGSLSRFGANALVNLSEWGTDEEEGFPSDVYLGAGLEPPFLRAADYR